MLHNIKPDDIKDVTPQPQHRSSSRSSVFQKIFQKWYHTFVTKVLDAKGFLRAAQGLYAEIKAFMSAADLEGSGYKLQHFSELKKLIHIPIRFALIAIGVAFFFFVIWGGIAPLDSAVVAHGSVVLSANRKVIQHREGGIIEKILVKDGDAVVEGQELIVLSDTTARAKMQQALSQLRVWKAVETRLLAEQRKDPEVLFDDEILDPEVQEVQQIIGTQTLLFQAKMKALKGQMDVFTQKIAQYKEAIGAERINLKALNAHDVLLKEQLANMESLFAQGYAKKTDLFTLRKQNEELLSRIAGAKAQIAQHMSSILTLELEILNLEHKHHEALNTELRDAHGRVLSFQEEYRAEKDVLHRSVIRAPNAGIVTHIKYHTVGGVVHQGAQLLEIIPQDDALIVEAQVLPKDIESVRVGLHARVQLSAYKTRLVPRVDGKVIYVSADKVNDERIPPYQQPYIVRVSLDPEELERINYEIKLTPGMPADVYIVKGERTFLQYMLSPILDSFHKAFKEA